MNLKKCLIVLSAIALLGSISPVFAEDNVLEQARQKYDKTKTTDNSAQDRAVELVRENTDSALAPAPEAPEAPAITKPVQTAEKTETVSTDDNTITVDVKVTVKPKQSAKAQAATEEPEATTEEAEAAAEKPAGRKRFFVFQFVPGLPRVAASDQVAIAISPVISSIGTVTAAQFGMFLAKADNLTGVQLSVLGDIAGQSEGVQVSSLFNISGKTEGVQVTGLFNIAKELDGVQTSGLFNIARNSKAVQAAGLFNIAGNLEGVQAAGLFNIGGDLTGVQAAGLLNVARKVKGVQVGLVNIADEVDGVAIGLINISKNGIHELNTWYESNNMLNFSIMNGTKNFYTVIQGGALLSDYFVSAKSLSLGAGLGARLGGTTGFYAQTDLSVRTLLNLDGTVSAGNADHLSAMGWRNVRQDVHVAIGYTNPFVTAFPSLRTNIGINFGHHFGIFLGGMLDVEAVGVWALPEQFKSPAVINMSFGGQQVNAYAKWFAGISLL